MRAVSGGLLASSAIGFALLSLVAAWFLRWTVHRMYRVRPAYWYAWTLVFLVFWPAFIATRLLDPLTGSAAPMQFLAYFAPGFLLGTVAFGTGLGYPGGGRLGLSRGAVVSLIMMAFLTLAYLLPALLLLGYLVVVFDWLG